MSMSCDWTRKKKIIFSLYFDVHQKQIAQLIYKRQKKVKCGKLFYGSDKRKYCSKCKYKAKIIKQNGEKLICLNKFKYPPKPVVCVVLATTFSWTLNLLAANVQFTKIDILTENN